MKPEISEYTENNNKIIRQRAEQYLLDFVIYLIQDGNSATELETNSELRKLITTEVEVTSELCALEDPSWGEGDIEVSTSFTERISASQNNVRNELFGLLGEFTESIKANQGDFETLAKAQRDKFTARRLEKDYNAATRTISKLQSWSAPVISAETSESPVKEQKPSSKPEPQIYGVSHYGAEVLVRDWMQFLGYQDAKVTQQSSDGGIDVETRDYVVQVKNYRGGIGVPAVRELLGVSISERKNPLLFTSGSLTKEAKKFAKQNSIPVVMYSAEDATLIGINKSAVKFLETSLLEKHTSEKIDNNLMQTFEVGVQLLLFYTSSAYSIIQLLNYRNSHPELFETDTQILPKLLIRRVELDAKLQWWMDQQTELVHGVSENIGNYVLKKSEMSGKAKEIVRNLTDVVQAHNKLLLEIYDALGVPN